MKTSRFKTNAKCSGCVAKIGEKLKEIVNAEQWTLDLSGPDKILEITSELPDEEIIKQIEAAGFKAEKIESGR